MQNKDDLTIVIQGPLHINTIRAIPYYKKYASKIIVSFWSECDQNLLNLIPDYVQQIPLVKFNWMNKCFNWGNNFNHAWTTYCGLEEVETEYSLKVRTDAFYPNLDVLLQNFYKRPNLIHCNNAFFQNDKAVKFHPTDHLWLSETNIMRKAVEFVVNACIPESRKELGFELEPVFQNNGALYLKYKTEEGFILLKNETLFCIGFLLAKGVLIKPSISSKIMKENYFITPLSDLKPFILNSRAHPSLIEDIFSSQPNSLCKIEDV